MTTSDGAGRNTGDAIISLNEVRKTYRSGSVEFEALCGISLDVAQGEYVAIIGPSGSQVDVDEHPRVPRRRDGGFVPPGR